MFIPSRRVAFALLPAFLLVGGPSARAPAKGPTLLHELVKPRFTVQGHNGQVISVLFSPDGRWLATTGGDHTVRLWDAATARPGRTFEGLSDFVYSAAFSPDGRLLAAGNGEWKIDSQPSHPGRVIVWDVATGRQRYTLRGHTSTVYRVVFSPDGKRLATSGGDRTVRLWDAATGKPLRTFDGFAAAVYDVAFRPDGKRLATAEGDFFQSSVPGVVRVWEADTGKPLLTLTGHTGPVYRVVYSRDGRRLATASHDHTARVWDADTGKPLVTLAGHAGSVFNVVFSPDGKRVATACRDNLVRVWDLAVPNLPLPLRGHTDQVFGVEFNPDGTRLVSGGDDRTARVWDVSALYSADDRLTVLAPARLKALWDDLADPDVVRAYHALWLLARHPREAMPFLHGQVQAPEVSDPRVARLLRDLDARRFAAREKAMHELAKLGQLVEPALRKTLEDTSSPEVRRRVERLLEKLEQKPLDSPDVKRLLRCALLLEDAGTPAAREVLWVLAKGGHGPVITTRAREALQNLESAAAARP